MQSVVNWKRNRQGNLQRKRRGGGKWIKRRKRGESNYNEKRLIVCVVKEQRKKH